MSNIRENSKNLLTGSMSSSEVDDESLRPFGSRIQKMSNDLVTEEARSEIGADRVASNASLMNNPYVFTVASLEDMGRIPNFFVKPAVIIPTTQVSLEDASVVVNKRIHSAPSKEELARIPSLPSVQSSVSSTGSNSELGMRNSDFAYLDSHNEPKSLVLKFGGETQNKRNMSSESREELQKIESLKTNSQNTCDEDGQRIHSAQSIEDLARIPSLPNVQSSASSTSRHSEVGVRNSCYAYLNSQMEPKSFVLKFGNETQNKRTLSTESREDLNKIESLPVCLEPSEISLVAQAYQFRAATPTNSDYAYLDSNNQLKSSIAH